MNTDDVTAKRREELALRLSRVQQRIARAAERAQRDPDEITLIAITKFHPVADLRALIDLGVTDVGESQEQEMTGKLRDLPQSWRSRVRMHFVGQLQTNKARRVALAADLVHSVDRARLVRALQQGAADRPTAGRPSGELGVLIQVDLREGRPGAEPTATPGGRGGVAAAAVDPLVETIEQAPGLRLRGVMAVAPPGGEATAREAFARLATISQQLRQRVPEADLISAGMSGDLELAIAAGATHLRVGAAILGERPPHR